MIISELKYILIGVSIVLSSCTYRPPIANKDIMQEYPWSLDMDELTPERADSIFKLMESGYGFDLSKIIIEAPAIKIKYFYGNYFETQNHKSFIINADNEKSLTAREILFKINQATAKHLRNDPHYFFEGLEFVGYEDGIPTYEIAQGS